MRVRPLFSALALLILAIVLAPRIALPPIVLAALTTLSLGAGVFLVRKRPALAVAFLLGAVFCVGLLRASDALTIPPGDPARSAPRVLTLEGTVADPPEDGSRGSVHFLLNASAGRVWVRLRDGANAPALGERVRVTGKVELPPIATNPGQFDWRAHLARQGVFSTLSARKWESLAPPGVFSRLVGGFRGAIQRATARNLQPEDAALMDGLLLSVRTKMPADLDDAFQRTGAVHVLSVSGLHLAALGAFLHALLTAVFPVKRGVRTALTLGIVWLYALAVGASPPVLRSAVMLTVVLAAPLLKRDAEPLHSLAFAALVALLQAPLALFDPGTQLSFVTSAAILAYLPALEAWLFPWEPDLTWRGKSARFLVGALCAGVVAHLGSAPLVAAHFHVFSVIAPLANIPLAALSEALLLSGLLAVLTGFLPLIGPLSWGAIGWGLRLLRTLTLALGAAPWASVSAGEPPVFLLVVYYLLLLGAAPYVRSLALRRRLFAPAPAGVPFRLPPPAAKSAGDVP